MPVFHSPRKETTASATLQRLERSLVQLRGGSKPAADFAQFERELHALFNEAERGIVAEELARLDINLARVEIGGCYVPRSLGISVSTYLM